MAGTHLKEGDVAPNFTGIADNGRQVSLNDFRGKKLILYFYPKDHTPGCTAQALNLRNNYERLRKAGYEVVGVSTDTLESHRKFKQKYNLPFTLIADPDGKIVKLYGVWGKKRLYGKEIEGTIRTTFIIEENGRIERIIRKVDTKNHTQQILGE